jgi:hypothetical protein
MLLWVFSEPLKAFFVIIKFMFEKSLFGTTTFEETSLPFFYSTIIPQWSDLQLTHQVVTPGWY